MITRYRHLVVRVLIASGLMGLVASGLAPAEVNYEVTDLGTGGYTSSWARDLNDSVQVAGTAGVGVSLHAFRWEDGTMTFIDRPVASGINAGGQVVGNSFSYLWYPVHGFLWREGVGSITIPHLSGDNSTRALGVNNTTQVVGYSWYRAFISGPARAIRWVDGNTVALASVPGYEESYAVGINNGGEVAGFAENGSSSTVVRWDSGGNDYALGTLPGGDEAEGYAINDAGWIVGWSEVTGGAEHAFLWVSGSGFTDLGVLGGDNSEAHGINEDGLIVGESEIVPGSYETHAFIYRNGQMLDLNDLLLNGTGWELEVATGINENGYIAGWGTHDGEIRGFLLTATQACCYASGACNDLLPDDCVADGGVPKGEGTDCATAICQAWLQQEACCFSVGPCQYLWPNDCAAEGGTPQGPGTDCLTFNCPDLDLLDACCFPNGTCEMLEPLDCLAQGGVWQGENTNCGSIACIELTGACCFNNGSCQDMLTADCVNTGGLPQGAGTVCTFYTCPEPEACCFADETCGDLPAGVCISSNGLPQGEGTDCATYSCEGLSEACCFVDGSCSDLSPFDCLDQQGMPAGPGTDCASVPCEQPEACCYSNVIGGGDTCENELPSACELAGDKPAGPGTWCLGDNDGDGMDDQCQDSIPGDLDHDGDVDLNDFRIFQANLTGPR